MNFYLFIKVKKGGGALVYVYVTTKSFNGYLPLGWDKVVMTPHICIDFWVKSA